MLNIRSVKSILFIVGLGLNSGALATHCTDILKPHRLAKHCDSLEASFRKRFKSRLFENLKYVSSRQNSEEKEVLFSYSDTDYLYAKIEFDEISWEKIKHVYLTSQTHSPKLLKNSDRNIAFELFPDGQNMYSGFLEDALMSVNHATYKLRVDKSMKEQTHFVNYHEFFGKNCGDTLEASAVVPWKDDFTFVRGETASCGEAFLITRGDKIVAGFLDPDTTYQEGDGATYYYKNLNGDLFINAVGDVSSLVIIRTRT